MGPALAEHERQLHGLPPLWTQAVNLTMSVVSHMAEGLPPVSEEVRIKGLRFVVAVPDSNPTKGDAPPAGAT